MVKKCPNQTMPINLPRGVNTPCSEKCSLTYDYGISKVTATNKKDEFGNYLEINCFDSPNNKVNFGLVGDLNINSVKLFRPSLNTYNGQKANAEIILTHSGGGKNVYICIPIRVSNSRSNSAKWFKQIAQFLPTRKQGTVPINTNNFTLNSIIPKASFVVYEGGVFCWGNGQEDVAIIYELESAITIYPSDLSNIKKLISKNSYNTYPTSDYLQYSSKGSRAGPGKKSGGKKSKELQCVPIYDQDGNKIPEGASDVNPSLKGTGYFSEKTSKASKVIAENTRLVIIICAVLVFMILLGLGIYYLVKRRRLAAASGAGSGSSGGSG